MKKHFTLFALSALFAITNLSAQNYAPATVTGFNTDVVAETIPALSSTSVTIDASGNVLYSQAYATAASTMGGLLASGNYNIFGNVYQLAPYNQANALKVAASAKDSFALVTPTAFNKISLLGFASDADASTQITLKFTDGSSTSYTESINYWMSSASSYFGAYGSTNRNTDVVNYNLLTPSMFKYEHTLSCIDAKKTISKIIVENTSSTVTSALIMAVSGIANPTISVSVSTTSLSCSTSTNGSAQVTVNGGSAPFAYFWNSTPTQTNSSASNLVAGNYTCTITDANSCVITETVSISTPLALVVSSVNTVSLACSTSTNAAASVTITGGTLPYSYSWNSSPTKTTATASNLTAGNYTCTITDANSCVITETVSIQAPTVSISTTSVVCTNSVSGSASIISVTGGTAPYSYTWTTVPVQTAATATNLAGGNYTYTVRDAANCVITRSVVTIDRPTVAVTISSLSCNGVSTGSATINSVTGFLAPLTYSWNTVPSQLTQSAVSLATGNYTCIIRDANNCVINRVVNIAQPTAILAVASGTAPVCNGLMTGKVRITSSGGALPHTYSWNTSPVQTTTLVTGLAAGIYTCAITDAKGCISTKTASAYIAPQNISIISNPSSTVCANTTVTLTASGNTTYTWSTGSTGQAIVITPTTTSSYSLTGTTFNGCKVVGNATVPTTTTGCVISVNELENTSTVFVYPNPNNGIIIVKLVQSYTNASIEIYDAIGKLVLKNQLVSDETILNVSQLESGVYFYAVKNSNGAILQRSKLIKE